MPIYASYNVTKQFKEALEKKGLPLWKGESAIYATQYDNIEDVHLSDIDIRDFVYSLGLSEFVLNTEKWFPSKSLQFDQNTREKLDKAWQELMRLCKDSRSFRMCVPVQDNDSDVLIGDGLKAAMDLAENLKTQAALAYTTQESWDNFLLMVIEKYL